MSAASAELGLLCSGVGSDPLLVQGGGGNGSIKDDGELWIKASGYRMSEVSASSGFTRVGLDSMLGLIRDSRWEGMERKAAQEEFVRQTNLLASGARPSMETGFHALLGRAVLHTHSVVMNAFACCASGESLLGSLGGDIVWIPYETPGLELARAIEARFGSSVGSIRAGVLEQHGFFSVGSSALEALDVTRSCLSLARAVLGDLPSDALTRISPSADVVAWAEGLAAASGLAARACSFAPILRCPDLFAGGALIPDDAIYTELEVHVGSVSEAPGDWFSSRVAAGARRCVALLSGAGVVVAGPEKSLSAMEESLLAHALVRELVGRVGAVTNLPEAESRYLLSLDSEAYRQRVAAGDAG